MTRKDESGDSLKILVDAETSRILEDVVRDLSNALSKKPFWVDKLRNELRSAAQETLEKAIPELVEPIAEHLSRHEEGLQSIRAGLENQKAMLVQIQTSLQEMKKPWYKKL